MDSKCGSICIEILISGAQNINSVSNKILIWKSYRYNIFIIFLKLFYFNYFMKADNKIIGKY
jgi:hypothetical protein